MDSAKLMIVEDEGLIAESIRRTVMREGYQVAATTGSGEEAIQLARETDPDLILMDQRLNDDIRGVEAAEEIQGTQQMPVVFMTAFDVDEVKEQAENVAFEEVLAKPVQDDRLLSTIELALS